MRSSDLRRIADARVAANFSELVFRCSRSVSSEAARVAAFAWFFAVAAAVVGGTAPIHAHRSCALRSSGLHAADTSRVQRGVSITAIAIRNFDDGNGRPRRGA